MTAKPDAPPQKPRPLHPCHDWGWLANDPRQEIGPTGPETAFARNVADLERRIQAKIDWDARQRDEPGKE